MVFAHAVVFLPAPSVPTTRQVRLAPVIVLPKLET
jgi:hypothetical protein